MFIKIRMAGKSQFIKISLYCSHQQVQNAHRRGNISSEKLNQSHLVPL